MNQSYVYIITNKSNRVLYAGITGNLVKRIYEHKNQLLKGFTYKNNIIKLVSYEVPVDIRSALQREKQVKGGARAKKINLIEEFNPKWKDLYDTLF